MRCLVVLVCLLASSISAQAQETNPATPDERAVNKQLSDLLAKIDARLKVLEQRKTPDEQKADGKSRRNAYIAYCQSQGLQFAGIDATVRTGDVVIHCRR